MRQMKQVALIVGLFFLLLAVNTSAGKPPVTINSGRFFNALIGRSVNIALIVRVEKHEGNRNLSISCEGIDDGIYVSSDKSLDGGDKEKFDFTFNLVSATYVCEAVLTRKVDGKTKEFRSSVEVTIY